MFTKLKKKLQDEIGDFSDNDKGASAVGPGLASPLSKQDDGESKASALGRKLVETARNLSSTNLNSEESTKEEVLAMLVRRTDQCKKLEAKISEYSIALKDKNKNIEKLESHIEKHQNVSSSRIKDLNEQAERAHAHYMDKLKAKNEEISELRSTIEALEASSGSVMTMNTEISQLKSQVQNDEYRMNEQQTVIEDLQKQLKITEPIVMQHELLLKQINDLTNDRDTHKAESVLRCEEIFQLNRDKDTLTEQMDNLTKDLSTANKMIEERDESIEKYKDRNETLEQRLMGHTLTGSEREQSLELAREILERKVADAEKQHTTMKSTMYEKITSLEKELSELQGTLMDCQNSNSDLLQQKQHSLLKLEEQSESLAKKEEEKTFLEKEMYVLQIDHSEILAKHSTLENFCEELQAREIEYTNTIETLTTDLKTTQDTLSNKTAETERLTAELHLSRLSTQQLSEKVERLQNELTTSQTTIDQSQGAAQSVTDELNSIVNERDRLLLRNVELSQNLASTQQQFNATKHDMDEKITQLANQQRTLTELSNEVVQLSSQDKVNENTQSKLSDFEKLNSDLEEQLNEKNKTIKSLQQRLTDVKKALQKELRTKSKVSTDDLSTDELSNTPLPTTSNPTPHMQPLATVSPLLHVVPSLSVTGTKAETVRFQHQHEKGPPKKSRGKGTSDDISFRYMRHVVIKFILSQESEALKLLAALTTLLHLTREEQRLIQETLEWKMSWFGSRPDQGHMQGAKAIYPSY